MIGAYSTKTIYCCCEKHLKKGETEWHKHTTDNLAHHLHIAFLFLHVCTRWAECMWFNMDASWLKLYWFYPVTHTVILWLWGSAGEGLGSKFIWCHWSKYTPWHVHETSTRWQMCCTGTVTEMNGCQLSVVWGCFKLHLCAVCHISLILFCALCSGLLFVTLVYHHMLDASFLFPAPS